MLGIGSILVLLGLALISKALLFNPNVKRLKLELNHQKPEPKQE
jgi:hypothetical protein